MSTSATKQSEPFPLYTGAAVISLLLVVVSVVRLRRRKRTLRRGSVREELIHGKTIVITGANTGLGKATALELAKRGGRIILACRNEKKGEAVARQIRVLATNPNVSVLRLDLASLASIREFVHAFKKLENHLHVLINNAAYMGPRATTEDGTERCFGVNYLGHFYLTHLLTTYLMASAPARIINVASDAYTKARLHLSDIALENHKYHIYEAYGRSKLCMVLWTLSMHRKYFKDGIMCVGVHPGPVRTEIMRNWPGMGGKFLRLISRLFFTTPQNGCQTIVQAALAVNMEEHSGKLLHNGQAMELNDYVCDEGMQGALWEESVALCGVGEGGDGGGGGGDDLGHGVGSGVFVSGLVLDAEEM